MTTGSLLEVVLEGSLAELLEDELLEELLELEELEELLELEEPEEPWLSDWDSLPLSEEEVPSERDEDSSSFVDEEEEEMSSFPHPARTRAPAARMRAYVFLNFMVGDSFPYSAGVQVLVLDARVMTPILAPST